MKHVIAIALAKSIVLMVIISGLSALLLNLKHGTLILLVLHFLFIFSLLVIILMQLFIGCGKEED